MRKLVAIFLLLPCSLIGQVLNPQAKGPYPVGVTTSVFIDHSRTDNFTKKPRTLVTEIYYPATDDSRSLPKNRFRDFFPGEITPQLAQALARAYFKPLEEVERGYCNDAVRDARVRPGKYPLVLFSHGNGGSRHSYTFWFDYLASHGFIIVSPDHTGNSRLTVIDGEIIPFQAAERRNSGEDRPRDMSFLLDEMKRWNGGADSRFAGRIDVEAVAVTGMSFGSFTAIRAADLDPRFKAVLAMAAAPPSHTNLAVPSLYMLGAYDNTIKEKGNAVIRDNYASHRGPAYLLELSKGGHYSFTDMFKLNKNFGDGVGSTKKADTGETIDFTPMELTYEIINSYSTAFLGVYLKGQKEYEPFLRTSHWPGVVVWKTNQAEATAAARSSAQ